MQYSDIVLLHRNINLDHQSRYRCPHGPSAGPGRAHGIPGIAFTHDYHLEKIAKKCIESRGYEPFTEEHGDEMPAEGEYRDFFVVQMDKSTCQSYNRGTGIFGYKGVPTRDAVLLLEKIAIDYGVFIGVIIQPTHRYDKNAPDALYHSVVKRRSRQYPFPLCQEHILRDYAKAVLEVSTHRVIQRRFWRAYRRDENGDIDNILIPEDIWAWYVDSSDEEETLSERDSDLETDDPD